MNTSQSSEFQETILLAEYVIKMALNELSALDQQSIKTLQASPENKSDISLLIQAIENAARSLVQAREVAKSLIIQNVEVEL